jgi:RNA polymerase sigma-70 factor (ECF subfamily)
MDRDMSESADGPQRYERFTALLVKHQPDLRAFIVAVAPTGTDYDEMLQLASVVAWRKFDQFDPATSFVRWICRIAKFEVLNDLRKRRRDRHLFNDELLELIADETIEESEQLAMERRALEACMNRLAKHDRELLTRCYAARANLTEIAQSTGRSANSLYKWLNRIRQLLLDCIVRNLAQEGCA